MKKRANRIEFIQQLYQNGARRAGGFIGSKKAISPLIIAVFTLTQQASVSIKIKESVLTTRSLNKQCHSDKDTNQSGYVGGNKMSEPKKPNSKDSELPENRLSNPAGDTQPTSEERRKAVRNILAGSGVVAGAATSGQWTKPLVEAVVLPAHAQTSATTMLVGNVNVSPVVGAPLQQKESVLDFFIGTANAGVVPSVPNLAGACMTMSITGSAFDLAISFASAATVNVAGTVAGGTLSGSGSGITVSGTVDLESDPQTATGNISDGADTFGFVLDTTQTSCTPVEVTTTPSPTTTTGTPTKQPTTTTSTTPGQTTTTTSTTPGQQTTSTPAPQTTTTAVPGD